MGRLLVFGKHIVLLCTYKCAGTGCPGSSRNALRQQQQPLHVEVSSDKRSPHGIDGTVGQARGGKDVSFEIVVARRRGANV